MRQMTATSVKLAFEKVLLLYRWDANSRDFSDFRGCDLVNLQTTPF
jgi:hypothetical protein